MPNLKSCHHMYYAWSCDILLLLTLFLLFYIFGRSALRSLGTLVPVLGVTWIFGIFAMDQSTDIFQYIFVIANSLQVSFQVWFLWLQFFLSFFSFFNILKSYSLESCDHSSLSCIWYQLMTLFVILQSLKQIFKLKKDRIFAVHEQSFNRHEDTAIYFNLLFIF